MSAYCYDGRFNDMDMLEVGRSMTYEEDKTHFGMWCIMNSPLLIGCNMTNIKTSALNLLKNTELIALNQDPLYQQAYVVALVNDCYILVKDLETLNGKKRAFAIFNPNDVSKNVTVNFSDLCLGGRVKVRDVFLKSNKGEYTTSFRVNGIPAHGTRIYVVEAEERLERTRYEAETAYISDYQELKNNQTEKTGIYEYATYCSAGLKAGWLGCSEQNDLRWRNVYSDKGGEYQLTIAYISGADRNITVSVNGETVQTISANSGGWQTVGKKRLTIQLEKGNNTIRLSNPNTWMPDIDYIEIAPTSSGIHTVDINGNTSSAIYDLNGRSLPHAPKKGIYIQDGKKITLP
jgi:hypothetical protein